MRICFVGPANSSHISKWCKWFTKHGHEVHVISFIPGEIENVVVHLVNLKVNTQGSDIGKLKYLTTGKRLKQLINSIQPDIINAHYATSYGVALALSGVNDYFLSVWGSDIYDFPKKSLFHKMLLEYSLKKAPHILSTSEAMAFETRKYSNKEIDITPFGVDMELFNPNKRTRAYDDSTFIVGTVKGLKEKYGISDILRAVSIIKCEGEIPILLRIAGKGPQEVEYHDLANALGINDITSWLGFISQDQAAIEWANMDVAIIPSTLESESFGVSAVEAQACGTAVIISDIPGLMEATNPGETSIVVKRKDPEEIAAAIRKLYKDEKQREEMRIKAVAYVREHYEINQCFENIQAIFEKRKN